MCLTCSHLFSCSLSHSSTWALSLSLCFCCQSASHFLSTDGFYNAWYLCSSFSFHSNHGNEVMVFTLLSRVIQCALKKTVRMDGAKLFSVHHIQQLVCKQTWATWPTPLHRGMTSHKSQEQSSSKPHRRKEGASTVLLSLLTVKWDHKNHLLCIHWN